MSKESIKRYPKSKGSNDAAKFVKSFESPGIFHLITVSEVRFIADLLNDCDPYLFQTEMHEALEIINALKPLKTETVLRIIEETEYGSGHRDSTK